MIYNEYDQYVDNLKIERDNLQQKLDEINEIKPLQLAMLFHKIYEELAVRFDYKTRNDTKQFNETSKNGKLMIATCEELLKQIIERSDV